jgi:hypothetical protein
VNIPDLLNKRFALFPILPNAKVPACANGCKDATTDIEEYKKENA